MLGWIGCGPVPRSEKVQGGGGGGGEVVEEEEEGKGRVIF